MVNQTLMRRLSPPSSRVLIITLYPTSKVGDDLESLESFQLRPTWYVDVTLSLVLRTDATIVWQTEMNFVCALVVECS